MSKPRELKKIAALHLNAHQASKHYSFCMNLISSAFAHMPCEVSFTYTEEQEYIDRIKDLESEVLKLKGLRNE